MLHLALAVGLDRAWCRSLLVGRLGSVGLWVLTIASQRLTAREVLGCGWGQGLVKGRRFQGFKRIDRGRECENQMWKERKAKVRGSNAKTEQNRQAEYKSDHIVNACPKKKSSRLFYNTSIAVGCRK